MINELLFVYGSLLNAGNEFAAYLSSNAHLHSTGKFKGKLYDIGEYPGAIINTDGTDEVTGSIYQLNYPGEALKILDDYEGFGTDQHQPNLFIRELLKVESTNGTIYCWIYLYNLPVDGLKQIKSGDYLDYLNKKSDG
ncbi:gamma-glutamylcyclotransferase family protein [Mucilaginibacter sp.]|uniref:gamma-glutamylcyclotransferase family protein n=1 Tax=Mucilaginibacter sp. TaxID=1882438 RepID=UPI002624A749|nr:gamma-glutamylcyclotransferase family protein [Mucilaginibacter sp.]MDB5030709.1 btrG [Mucilaginibacter sp.]